MFRSALLLALLASPAFAQPGGAADSASAKTVAPFIDEHTLVIVRIEIPRVNIDATLKLAAALVGNAEDMSELSKSLKAWAKRFAASGGKDIFLTYGAG